MSEPIGPDFHRMRRRSPRRVDAVVMLNSMSEAYPRQLAAAIGVDVSRLWQILLGDGEDYSIEWAPYTLGLIEIVIDERKGRKLVITDRGRRKARQWTAMQTREDAARRARRDLRQVPRVHPQAPRPGGPAAPTPVELRTPTASFTWSLPTP